MTRSESERRPACAPITTITEFYREEFIKHRECLEQQREFYSERAIGEVEAALARILAELDRLCARENAGELVGRLLRKLDVVTGLSAYQTWSDHPPILH
ncbi:MAG TPA: hypothetical protein VNK92_05920 [Vicinamibacterales bacterium]|jgi:hypothetical protein|nr:hypothetical protein [Vicinamibacterales bacterium]